MNATKTSKSHSTRPLVLDAATLADELAEDAAGLILLDVRSLEAYSSGHLPGALRLDPASLSRSDPPIGGLLPDAEVVQNWAKELSLSRDSAIVVYDEGRATSAARALWVLHAYGFSNVHWLDGGIQHWTAEGLPITTESSDTPAVKTSGSSDLTLTRDPSVVLTRQALQASLATNATDDDTGAARRQPVDARTAGEFAGTDVRSQRGGHMPGAVHYEWLELFTDAGLLKPESELRAALRQLGLNEDDAFVVYCQSHQRSAVTYVVLKHLGFENVAALDGAWSNWGNQPDTPIER